MIPVPDRAASGLARVVVAARTHPRLCAVFIAGVLARAILVPITHGADFVVWDLASQATLRGTNIYAHHPAYPGGPYAYLPLFVYVELPMQWLALHTPAPFLILGKVPIVAADCVVAAVVASWLIQRGTRDPAVAVATAAYFLNPLVLYNGAFYGRFDSVCVALLLLALRAAPSGRPFSWRFSVLFALSVAAKTFPILLVARLLRDRRGGRYRVVVGLVAVLALIAAPYLVSSPLSLGRDVLHNIDILPGSLSWQVVFHGVLSDAAQRAISEVLLGVLAVALILLPAGDDLHSAVLRAILLFLVCSKVVVEQYLLWPLALLAVRMIAKRSPASAALLVLLSAAGMLVNPYIHPFGREPAALDVGLALVVLVFVVTTLRGVPWAARAPVATAPRADATG